VLKIVIGRIARVVSGIFAAVERNEIGERVANVSGVDGLIQVLEDAANFSRNGVRIGRPDAILYVEFAAPVHRRWRGATHVIARVERK
jgi:hypothetical protein